MLSRLRRRARAGKTLQGITLLWTLLQGGHPLLGSAPLARRVIICCPTSLVNNWDSECVKWLKARQSVPRTGRLGRACTKHRSGNTASCCIDPSPSPTRQHPPCADS
jgi:SNF2 family DNA or RNA helicase